MIDAIVWTLKDYFRLADLVPLFALLAISAALTFGTRTARWGRRLLVLVVGGYWFLATPIGSWLITWPLVQRQPRVHTAADAAGAQAVVVLGGGIKSYVADGLAVDTLPQSSALRLIEGVRVSTILGHPLLLQSGGNSQRLDPPRPEAAAFEAAAVRLGVPADRIMTENESRTTREQAFFVKKLLDARRVKRFVLVTSPLHMTRSLALFRAAGLDPIPSATALRGDVDRSFWTPLPDAESLVNSDGAIYEYVALAYYRARGWLKPTAP